MILSGKNIKLAPLEKDDLPKSLKWVNDRELCSRMLRVLPVTSADQKKWYDDIVNSPSRIVFAVKTCDSGTHIGNTGFYNIDWIHRRAEFWILIGDGEYRGRGIGVEVVKLMQQYAFRHLNLNKIYLNVGVENERAVKLYEKTGFVREGTRRQHYFIEGRYIDVFLMSCLKREYNNSNG